MINDFCRTDSIFKIALKGRIVTEQQKNMTTLNEKPYH